MYFDTRPVSTFAQRLVIAVIDGRCWLAQYLMMVGMKEFMKQDLALRWPLAGPCPDYPPTINLYVLTVIPVSEGSTTSRAVRKNEQLRAR
jgi:hypothetical protein